MSGETKTVLLTEKNFTQEIGRDDGPILVDFWAPWCGPCHTIAPVLEELAADYSGRARIGKLNVDDFQTLAGQFGVQSIPTLILFRNGKVLDQAVGAAPKPNLKKLIDRYL